MLEPHLLEDEETEAWLGRGAGGRHVQDRQSENVSGGFSCRLPHCASRCREEGKANPVPASPGQTLNLAGRRHRANRLSGRQAFTVMDGQWAGPAGSDSSLLCDLGGVLSLSESRALSVE